jgi:hypothetical protein
MPYTDPLITALSLPKPELEPFTGDVAKYRFFVASFDSRIGNRCVSEADKLYFLNQYLRDEPRDLIQGCFYAKDGYTEARRLLEAEYGHPYKLSMHFVKKIQEWPIVKADDAKALKAFSHFLIKAEHALSGVRYSHMLDHPSTLVDVVKKLPSYLRNKWNEQAHRLSLHSPATFADLARFIANAAAVANDPVFGRQPTETAKGGHAKVGRSVASVDRRSVQSADQCQVSAITEPVVNSCAARVEATCAFCKGNHELNDCHGFNAKSIDEKRSFVKSNRLCFGCFAPGHYSKGCSSRKTCSKCGKLHPSSLHVDGFSLTRNQDASTLQPESSSSGQTAAVSVTSSANGCALVHIDSAESALTQRKS